jgi:hypothetical protein
MVKQCMMKVESSKIYNRRRANSPVLPWDVFNMCAGSKKMLHNSTVPSEDNFELRGRRRRPIRTSICRNHVVSPLARQYACLRCNNNKNLDQSLDIRIHITESPASSDLDSATSILSPSPLLPLLLLLLLPVILPLLLPLPIPPLPPPISPARSQFLPWDELAKRAIFLRC